MMMTTTSKAKQIKAARARARFLARSRDEARRIELATMRRFDAACEARHAAPSPESDERMWMTLAELQVARDIRGVRQHHWLIARERLGLLFA